MEIRSLLLDQIPIGSKVRNIIASVIVAVDPFNVVRKAISLNGQTLLIHDQEYFLEKYGKIYLIGIGKASQKMALAIKEILSDHINSGFLITKHIDSEIAYKLLPNVYCAIGDHPIPGKNSLDSTKKLIDFLGGLHSQDLVICLISGGGSALMVYPRDEILYEDVQKLTRLLVKSGANINQINAIRKHIDHVKGGGLIKAISPAFLITLILSDVVGDPLDVIASGPTVPDPTTFTEALMILKNLNLDRLTPRRINDFLLRGEMGQEEETLKSEDKKLKRVKNYLVANNTYACQVAKNTAVSLGFETKLISTSLKGEASQVGKKCVIKLKRILSEHNTNIPICLIWGGETTVTVSGCGKGGRNQELALAAAIEMSGMKNICCLSFATDGEDGPTDAAGGIVNGQTLLCGEEQSLSAQRFLRENNSYEYLNAVGGLIKTGPTGTNVNDITLLFAY